MTEDASLRIVTGSVYHPPSEDYPRLLVMRRWPRGVAKGAVDQWERELGPSDRLLSDYRDGAVDWHTFEETYRREVEARPELLEWVLRMARTTGVAVLCSTHEPCHRDVLAALLSERAATSDAR
jgi:uncharacterized protein YeaO (DUF488 family)